MKLSTLLLVGAASAASASTTNKPFNIMALRSASPIHFASTSAALRNLYLNYNDQNASCADGSDNHGVATFSIRGEELFLFGSEVEQKVFVDRSGMGTRIFLARWPSETNKVIGQGKVGYITGAQPGPHYAETKGWATDQWGNLHFRGEDLIACPNDDNSWTLWLYTGVDDPAGNEGCLGLSARTTEVQHPVPCTYTQ